MKVANSTSEHRDRSDTTTAHGTGRDDSKIVKKIKRWSGAIKRNQREQQLSKFSNHTETTTRENERERREERREKEEKEEEEEEKRKRRRKGERGSFQVWYTRIF
ncbi:hypothetical protein ACOSQ2_021928 [Xanthoceras sorbifolium]